MGVIAEALMMRLRALVYPRLLTNKDILRFRSLSLWVLKPVFFFVFFLVYIFGCQSCVGATVHARVQCFIFVLHVHKCVHWL